MVPTPVFDAFWKFAVDRQKLFFMRHSGAASPWTDDPILAGYRFTNAYRVADRVSQFLIRRVIRASVELCPEDQVFRVLLFKIFNRIETWNRLEAELGPIKLETFSVEKYAQVLALARSEGNAIYSAAYVMPAVTAYAGKPKHFGHLSLLESIFSGVKVVELLESRTMAELYTVFKSIPSIGKFLAYQYATDSNYTELFGFDESDWVVAGPGAIDGVSKSFESTGSRTAEEVIRHVYERQTEEFAVRGLSFEYLGGRLLQPIDIQNLFCEISKYSRKSHPEIAGRSGRTRIKQKFTPSAAGLDVPVFPRHWRLEGDVAGQIARYG